ncbi:MAG: hypothetical protein GF370_04775 [Candidatus Nealsonbacteria bacterium]|nr:hypothetical protein [Candidatus Nealsonbacteria bacterium]
MADFILKKKGEQGLEKIEKAMKELGHPINYKEIKPMAFYSMGFAFVTLILSKKILGFEDKEFQKMGKLDAQTGPVRRLFMRFLVSLDMALEEVPSMWRRYHTEGNLRFVKVDKEQGTLVLRLEDFPTIDSHLQYLIGYFSAILQMIVGSETSCEVRECDNQEKECYKFLLKW